MQDEVRIAKTIPTKLDDDIGMGGDTYIDAGGNWAVRLACWNGNDEHELHMHESDTFEFAGATWQVTKIYEPNTRPRGMVAELTRITEPAG